jgi:hypothetical protein
MRLFALPVSGGSFPIQLGLMSEICSLGVIPDLVLGSSGGNVSAYIGLAADWNPYGMERVASMLHCNIFAKPWLPWPLNGLPSMIMGYFKGSVYQAGEESCELFKKIFTSENIRATEIWTGTLNRTNNKPQFFCNRHESSARFKKDSFDTKLLNCMPLTYLDGDIEKIANVCLASASIPILVPDKIIDGCCHTDGGTAFASPLTALIDQVINSAPHDLHVDYFSSFDMEAADTRGQYNNLLEHGSLTASEMVRSMCLLDRMSALSLLRGHGNVRCVEIDKLNRERLIEMENERSKYKRTVLELFPCPNVEKSVSLTKFQGNDIISLIQRTRKSYKARLWILDQNSTNNTPKRECPWFLS